MTQNDALWAERKGTRHYRGRNGKGATVEIGTGEGQFTPGELIKLALATCNTLSADHTLARVLGEDFQASVGVETDKDEERNSYKTFRVEIVTDLSEVDDTAKEKLVERALGAIDKHCTVGHTIEDGATYETTIVEE